MRKEPASLGSATNAPHRKFDWASFLIRTMVAVVGGTLWLVESVRGHDRTGAIVAVAIGYVILPVIAYFHTRYYNMKFMTGIVTTIRRWVGGRARD